MKLSALGFFLLTAHLHAQPWWTPASEWTEKDARRVLSSSPWTKRAGSSGATVRWESAFVVREALRMLGIAPPIGEGPGYAIAVLGVFASNRSGATASLQHNDKEAVAAAEFRVVEQMDGPPAFIFFFSRKDEIREPGVLRLPLGINLNPDVFHFTGRVNGIEIRSKFSVRDMLYLRKLDL